MAKKTATSVTVLIAGAANIIPADIIAYVVLAVAGLAEGTSLTRVLIQFRGEARRARVEVLDHVRASPDMTVKAALFEDSAAMVGSCSPRSG